MVGLVVCGRTVVGRGFTRPGSFAGVGRGGFRRLYGFVRMSGFMRMSGLVRLARRMESFCGLAVPSLTGRIAKVGAFARLKGFAGLQGLAGVRGFAGVRGLAGVGGFARARYPGSGLVALTAAALFTATGALWSRVPCVGSLGKVALILGPLGRVVLGGRVLGRPIVDGGLVRRGLVGWSPGLPRIPDRRRGGPGRTGAHRANRGDRAPRGSYSFLICVTCGNPLAGGGPAPARRLTRGEPSAPVVVA